jgi:XTP/dITP diphosphohydrolase
MSDKPRLRGPGFLATGNSGKLREMIPLCREYFQIEDPLEGMAPDGAVEHENTFGGNALIKARFLCHKLLQSSIATPFWVLADDSGLSVDHLEGRPGVHSARYAGDHVASERHIAKLIEELRRSGSQPPHSAHYSCALALIEVVDPTNPSHKEYVEEGQCYGEIIDTPKGSSGFGYDPVFYVAEFAKTFSEVSYEEKNSISHRRHAFERLQKTLLQRCLAALVFCSSIVPTFTQADTLSALLKTWQSEGFLQLPRLPTPLEAPMSEDIPQLASLPAETRKLLQFYEVTLAAKLSWKQQPLAPELQLPTSRPARLFFNTHLLHAFVGQKRVATFRPVDTTSGCESGCAPITFHLMLRESSRTPEVLQDPSEPLLKKGHARFTQEDMDKLARTLRRIPALIPQLPSSSHTTDSREQTWPVYRSTLVENAAYTSYRVYEAALQTLEALHQPSKNRIQSLESANDLIGEAYRVSTLSQAETLWKKLLAQNKAAPQTPLLEQQVRSSLLAALSTWRFTQNPDSNHATLSADLKASNIESLASLKCKVLETLIVSPVSRARTLRIPSAEFSACPGLDLQWAKILSSDSVSKDFLGFLRQNSKQLPEFFMSRPKLLKELMDRVPDSETSLRIELGSVLKAEFPRYPLDERFFDVKQISERESQLKQKTLALISDKLGRIPSAKLEKFEGSSLIPVKGKQIYVFFSSWCPHCRKILEIFRDEIKDPALWKKVLLVEVHSKSDGLLKAQLLCSDLKLPKSACAEMLLLPSAPNALELNRALKISSVPRILITDPSGKILNFDFRIDEEKYRDPLRRLRWTLD